MTDLPASREALADQLDRVADYLVDAGIMKSGVLIMRQAATELRTLASPGPVPAGLEKIASRLRETKRDEIVFMLEGRKSVVLMSSKAGLNYLLDEHAIWIADKIEEYLSPARSADQTGVLQDDLRELLQTLGMDDGAQPASPHEVFQSALKVLKERLAFPAVDRDALAKLCDDIADKHGDSSGAKSGSKYLEGVYDGAVRCASAIRAALAGNAQGAEPVAYRYTMNMELGQSSVTYFTKRNPSPWGKPGKDFDAFYTVTETPLYDTPPSTGTAWRTDFENAPKDGTRVLMYDGGSVVIGYWYKHPSIEGWITNEFDCGDFDFSPTKWAPLPATGETP